MVPDDNYWMTEALKLARLAALAGEVPVGAVVIHEHKIIGSGFNSPIQQHDPSAHAEMLALRQAAMHMKNYRLLATTLYVTLEPCVMCIGAMLHARIQRLVFGASDPKTGAVGGKIDLLSHKWNHQIDCCGGVLTDECGAVLRDFFQARR